MIEEFRHQGVLYALIIRHGFHREGVHFVTPGDFSQQLAYMSRPTGHRIQPHFHRDVHRDVHRTQEVLVIRKGRLRVDFYDHERRCIGSRELGAGDVILLSEGGHGFEVIDACEMFEVKQGPYLGDDDKQRFDGVDAPGADTR